MRIEKRRYSHGFFIQQSSRGFSQNQAQNKDKRDITDQSDTTAMSYSPNVVMTVEEDLNLNIEQDNPQPLIEEEMLQEDNASNPRVSHSTIRQTNGPKLFSLEQPVKWNRSIPVNYKDEGNGSKRNGSQFAIIAGIVLLVLLGIFVLFLFALASGFGSPLAIVILLGIAVLVILATIVLLIIQLYR